ELFVVAVVRDTTERRATEERAIAAERDLARFEDRERIAHELHDTVIQRLFATGMALQAMTGQLPPDAAARLDKAVDDLDQTIRDVRAAISTLRTPLATTSRPPAGRARGAAVDDDGRPGR